MSDDYKWMQVAVDEGKKSISEDRDDPSPKVGAVLVKNNIVIAKGFRGQTSNGAHAEFGMLESLKGQDISGSTLYTTLEPCSRRNPPKIPCAQRIIDCDIKEVVIGIYDPNPSIYREGWKLLNRAGILLRDFSSDLRDEIRRDNKDFLSQYEYSKIANDTPGKIRFDYSLKGGKYNVSSKGIDIQTQWSTAGKGVIHAVHQNNNVVLARHARNFSDIDDPSALWDHSHYTVTVREGEIVIFRNNNAYVLVKVLKVLLASRGDDRTELVAEYQFRFLPSY